MQIPEEQTIAPKLGSFLFNHYSKATAYVVEVADNGNFLKVKILTKGLSTFRDKEIRTYGSRVYFDHVWRVLA